MQHSSAPHSLVLHASSVKAEPFFGPEDGPGSPAAGFFEKGEPLQITKIWRGRTDDWCLVRSKRDASKVGWISRSGCQLEYFIPEDMIAINDLGLKTLANCEFSGTNVILSPYGLGRLTSVLMAAAAGKTLRGLKRIFPNRLKTAPSKTMASTVFTSIDFLLKKPDVQIAQVFQDFASNFPMGLQDTLFDERSRVAVNSAVSQLTDGMISELFAPSDWSLDLKVAVVNTNCFLGKWKTAFQADLTTDQPFHVNSKNSISVRMMNAELSCHTFECSDLQVEGVVLPFENSDEEAVLVLPNPGVSLDSLVPEMSSEAIGSLVRSSTDMRVNLSLPKFQFETSLDLFEAMPQLQPLRESNPDWSGLSDDPDVVVSKIVQKSRIEVSESGVRAASATAISFGASALFETVQVARNIVFERPFLFFLRHAKSQALLFTCVIYKPT